MGKQMQQMQSLLFTISKKDVDIVPMSPDPWRVGKIVAQKNDVVTWKCRKKHSIFVMFPKAHTPLSGGVTEVSAVESVFGIIDGKAQGVYPYTILVQDSDGNFHSVEGDSPPVIIIQG